MPPSIALLLWFMLLLALLRFDPAREPGISSALWVSLTWFFFVGSRQPSQWLYGNTALPVAEAMQEGNSLDLIVYSLLILLAFGILMSRSMSRSFDWRKFFSANVALTAIVSFALLSVLWSDFPFITLKRWIRDLGIYLVILVVLSDPRPFEAVRSLLRRLLFVLISLSILLIKYFPEMSIAYDWWTGQANYVGPTTSKNMLGVLCLVSGLFFFWDTLTRWGDRKQRRTRWIICVNVAFFSMTLWLLQIAASATSNVCFVLGCLVLAAAHSKPLKRSPALLILIPAGIGLYLFLQFALGIDIRTVLAEAVGRSSDLHGRTNIWRVVLSADPNPFVGVGYQSFWLGPQLLWIWAHPTFAGINEAHNGYIEVYLNLGVVGLLLLVALLIESYQTIWRKFMASSNFGSLSLALWTTFLFYNGTESAAFIGFLWVVFLLGVIAVPTRGKRLPANTVAPYARSSLPTYGTLRRHVTSPAGSSTPPA